MAYLGIDTSNYTTSAALFFPEENRIVQSKMLLPVKVGEKGLRQSDAVFHHTVQLSQVCNELFSKCDYSIDGIGASAYPRMAEGSYMPCFLVGLNTAKILSSVNKTELKTTSHQIGHILAALYSCDRLELINQKFIAFHLSGGTTEALLVEPDEEEIIRCTLIGKSTDLKAGQAVDRVGVMLGMKFPCGPELEKLANESRKTFRVTPSVKDCDISLSGVENKCKKMLEDGWEHCDIAAFCLEYICVSLERMTANILGEYGDLPLLYAGGVMSNSMIRARIEAKFGGLFASPEFSADNAAGVAIMTYFKERKNK